MNITITTPVLNLKERNVIAMACANPTNADTGTTLRIKRFCYM